MTRGGCRGGRRGVPAQDLAAAAAIPLVLTALSDGESPGYAILVRVRELAGGKLGWTDAMVYPLLHRLRRLGYVTADWRTLGDGRRRRCYAITDDGHAALAEWRRRGAPTTPTPRDLCRGRRWPLAAELHAQLTAAAI